jgi:hypothetical protein
VSYQLRWYVVGAKRGRYWHAKYATWELAAERVSKLRSQGFHYDRPSGVRVFIPPWQIARIEARPVKARNAKGRPALTQVVTP